jgi:hypothetical protein
MPDAYIFDHVRTPRGKGKKDGSLHEVTPIRLATQMLEAIRDRNKGLDTRELEDVILGCVTPVGKQGTNIARTAVMMAGYDESVPGVQINRFCASGLDREHRRGEGHVRSVAHGYWRRRRIHEPRAHGVGRRRMAGRPRRGDANLFRAPGHQRRSYCNEIRHQPR